MKSMKPKNIEVVKEESELDKLKLELKIKQDDLDNRHKILDFNNLLKAEAELEIRWLELKIEEGNIVKVNPLGYKETEAWKELLIKRSEYTIDESLFKKQKHDTAMGPVLKQIEICEKDIAEYPKQIAEIEAKIKKLEME